MGKLAELQAQVQGSIEKGIKFVEESHMSIAGKSFSYAEKLESKTEKLSVKSLKEKHDEAATGLYASALEFNKKINGYVADAIAKVEKEEKKPAAKTTAKKAPGRKPAAKKTEQAA